MNMLLGSMADVFLRIAGFQTSRSANSVLWAMRPQRDARTIWDDSSRYTGAALREIRKRNGVGRPPAVGLARIAEAEERQSAPALGNSAPRKGNATYIDRRSDRHHIECIRKGRRK